jgi:hypothetical protein
VRLDQVATAAAAPKKQPNIFAAFGAKVPAKKSKEIELREKKDNAALFRLACAFTQHHFQQAARSASTSSA